MFSQSSTVGFTSGNGGSGSGNNTNSFAFLTSKFTTEKSESNGVFSNLLCDIYIYIYYCTSGTAPVSMQHSPQLNPWMIYLLTSEIY